MNNKETIEDILKPVLSGKVEEIYTDLVPEDVENYMQSIGYSRKELWSNGKEFDFCLIFADDLNMKQFQLCGCWYTHTQKFAFIPLDERVK